MSVQIAASFFAHVLDVRLFVDAVKLHNLKHKIVLSFSKRQKTFLGMVSRQHGLRVVVSLCIFSPEGGWSKCGFSLLCISYCKYSLGLNMSIAGIFRATN